VIAVLRLMITFSVISWREQPIFNELMAALYYTNTLNWTVIVLAHYKTTVCVAPLRHVSSQFRPNQSLRFTP